MIEIMNMKNHKRLNPECCVGGVSSGLPPMYRGYDRACDRERAIKALTKLGYNYFVCYKDLQSDYALSVGWARWAGQKGYVNR